ncbi:MAG: prepilin peptidase [Planctomycetota bacterium]
MLPLVQAACLFALLIASAVTDFRERRVSNGAVAGAIVGGLLLQALRGSWQGFQAGLGGLLVGFGIFYPLYYLGGLGAGDAKLMAAVGALTSWRFVLWATVYTSFAGALLAVGTLFFRGGWREALHRAATLKRRERKAEVAQGDRRRTIPYAAAICAGSAFAFWWITRRTGAWPW